VTTPTETKPWFVYLVRAANGALYCGISNDPVRRFASHQSGKVLWLVVKEKPNIVLCLKGFYDSFLIQRSFLT